MRQELTGCSEEEFTCSDGSCVSMTSRCNGKNDCSDETDEAECKAFVQSVGYNPFEVPPPLGNRTKHDVSLTIDILDIVETIQFDKTFSVSYNAEDITLSTLI